MRYNIIDIFSIRNSILDLDIMLMKKCQGFEKLYSILRKNKLNKSQSLLFNFIESTLNLVT